jgi:hypothetical protein
VEPRCRNAGFGQTAIYGKGGDSRWSPAAYHLRGPLWHRCGVGAPKSCPTHLATPYGVPGDRSGQPADRCQTRSDRRVRRAVLAPDFSIVNNGHIALTATRIIHQGAVGTQLQWHRGPNIISEAAANWLTRLGAGSGCNVSYPGMREQQYRQKVKTALLVGSKQGRIRWDGSAIIHERSPRPS